MDRKEQDRLNGISRLILQACLSVHKEMGPGLLESVYQFCLIKEFQLRGVAVSSNVPVPLVYKGHTLNKDYVIDLLIESDVILELKSVDAILPVHEAQLISYLKLTKKNLGFLVNFNVPLFKGRIQ